MQHSKILNVEYGYEDEKMEQQGSRWREDPPEVSWATKKNDTSFIHVISTIWKDEDQFEFLLFFFESRRAAFSTSVK